MLSTVDALLPLSLLEAVRNVDTPDDQLDAEYVDEWRNKRLGLSDTIYAQIKRHNEAVKRGQRIGQDESVALAKLIGRRPRRYFVRPVDIWRGRRITPSHP